jgi:hypothetical protein
MTHSANSEMKSHVSSLARVVTYFFVSLTILGQTFLDVNAQTNGNGNGNGTGVFSTVVSISATATILESIELDVISNINLGQIRAGMEMLNINPQSDDRAGKLTIRGRPNATIQVLYPPRLDLIRVGGIETIMFDYMLSVNTEDNQFNSTPLNEALSNVNLGPDGVVFIWIGGEAELSNIVFGQYEGEISFEIEYI